MCSSKGSGSLYEYKGLRSLKTYRKTEYVIVFVVNVVIVEWNIRTSSDNLIYNDNFSIANQEVNYIYECLSSNMLFEEWTISVN